MNAMVHSAALMLASSLLGERVALASSDPTMDHELYPEEATALIRATDSRRREFAAGRMAARLALRELGAPATAIPMGQDRAPIWPPGLLGTIAHTDSACLAAAAWEGEVRLLGLDMEPDQPLAADLVPTICTEAEQNWLATQETPGQLAKLIFSAKECAYKAQYPLTRTLFGFDMLETQINLADKVFSVTFQSDISPFHAGETLEGRFAIGHGLIVTALVRPA